MREAPDVAGRWLCQPPFHTFCDLRSLYRRTLRFSFYVWAFPNFSEASVRALGMNQSYSPVPTHSLEWPYVTFNGLFHRHIVVPPKIMSPVRTGPMHDSGSLSLHDCQYSVKWSCNLRGLCNHPLPNFSAILSLRYALGSGYLGLLVDTTVGTLSPHVYLLLGKVLMYCLVCFVGWGVPLSLGNPTHTWSLDYEHWYVRPEFSLLPTGGGGYLYHVFFLSSGGSISSSWFTSSYRELWSSLGHLLCLLSYHFFHSTSVTPCQQNHVFLFSDQVLFPWVFDFCQILCPDLA